ncbi:hypothetical protein GWI33_014193 [Rhynchophorus ferrugineus]|uniref:CHK kinase-like domain-containing protein n=1 Tax=Rhynchophorus ferrugineus TaxID=354439 RepID=A0A834I5J7_RHYFE|nr:hypothetical protein GWI33_014193 [Rhynchophorus ferrugineus]
MASTQITTDKTDIKADLDKILQGIAEKLNFKNYELIPNVSTDYGDGFVSLFYTGKVLNKDTGEVVSVAIKKAPPYQTFDYKRLFSNEGLFYNTIFPCLDAFQRGAGVLTPFENVPVYYSSEVDGNTHIALENLKVVGYRMHDKKQYLDEDHLEYIFKLYGKFHGLSFVLKHKDPEKYLEIMENVVNVFESFSELLLEEMRKAVGGAFRTLDPEDDHDAYIKFKNIIDNMESAFKNACSYTGKFSCITHGDCWSNNMLFKYSESGKLQDVKLIDFQLLRDSSPVHDLSYFFYSGASKKDFDNLDYYLQLYHRSFSDMCSYFNEDPNEIFPFEALKKEWKENALLGVLMGVYLWQVKLLSKETLQKVIMEAAKDDETMKKAWAVLMDELFDSDEYKERVRAILIHATQYGVV